MGRSNIVLIGMPNVGKSSTGRVLSNLLNRNFIDTDLLLTQTHGKKPPEIVKEWGLQEFLRLQDILICALEDTEAIIATGGAVIFNPKAMEHLQRNGVVIFLEQDLQVLEQRIQSERRFATADKKSFEEMYKERKPLYLRYADIQIDCREKDPQQIAQEIIHIVSTFNTTL